MSKKKLRDKKEYNDIWTVICLIMVATATISGYIALACGATEIAKTILFILIILGALAVVLGLTIFKSTKKTHPFK
jgi:hypothetical protein